MTDRNICLVTGAAGFIGSRYIENCQAQGIPTIAVDLLSHFEDRPDLMRIRFDRIIDREELFDTLEKEKLPIGSIVHLGACANTLETREDYLDRINVKYSQWLWNYATKRQIPFVYASSAATYGNGEQGYDDDESKFHLLKPLNLYGLSKLRFDIWALEQEKLGHAPPSWAGFKFFNVYGFGEGHKGSMASVVLHAFKQIEQNGKARLFQSHREGIPHGHQKRDFIAVEDVISVLEFARTGNIKRGVYNLGTGQARTFLSLVQAVFAAMSRPEDIEFVPTPESIRNQYQYFTEAKMDRLRRVGYTKQFLSIEEGVKLYVEKLQKQKELKQ